MRFSLLALLLTTFLRLFGTSVPAPRPAPVLPPSQAPLEFVFSSGAGAWRTSLLLNADGTFSGRYSDSDMGDTGPSYPNGTVYLCAFSGRFEIQPSDGSGVTPLHLTELFWEQEPGTQEIKDGVLYFYTGPHGFYNQEILCPNFLLYPPNTPTEAVSPELLSWWPGRYEAVEPDTLGGYALYNPDAGTAFFTYPD